MTQYQSIYRKWRPQFFEDIIGQEHISRTLKNAIKLNRIAHAYLFSGPRGVGKTTTARIFAKALNCQTGPTEHPCNRCPQCIRINSGQSMDVVEIDGASNRGIDEIRELRSKIGFAPVEGKYKIYIIDEVHMLTNEAFNALLKTLEEPPSNVLFIFATTTPQKVPKTILSRCQCFSFRRISIDEITTKLKKISEEEKLSIDELSLRLIAESATGSLRDAESILEQVVTYSQEKITEKDVREILGIVPQKLFYDFIESILHRDTKKAIEFVNQLVKKGTDLHQFVQDLIIYIHRLSLVKIVEDNSFTNTLFNEEEIDFKQILEMTKKMELPAILDIIEELNQIESKIKYHHYPWILLEVFVVKVTQLQKVSQENSINRVIYRQTEVNQEVVNDSHQESDGISRIKENKFNKVARISSNQSKEGLQFNELWPKILSRIKNERISLYAFLTASSSIQIENDQLIVGFHRDCLFHKESLEKRENRENLESILREEIKSKIRLKCFIDENSNLESVHFGLDKVDKDKNKIEKEQPMKHANSIRSSKEDNSSASKMLEEARDLFGGNVCED